MQETITFNWEDGSMTICLNEFFPCSAERLYKLLDTIREEPWYDRREETFNRICGYLYDAARDLEEKLPDLNAAARSSGASASSAFRALEKTRERIRTLQSKMAGKDMVQRKKIREQIEVMRQLRDTQSRALKQAREYAYQAGRDRVLTQRKVDRLRQNREQVLRWRKQKNV
jgi:hypothetical protein